MDTLEFTRSKVINSIPSKKLLETLSAIENSTDDLKTKNAKVTAVNRYAESNIPIEYWTLKMERDFKGDPRLLEKYNEYIKDLKVSYINGVSICFAGSHGLGKTMTINCILKQAVLKGYNCLYADLASVVSVLTQASNEEKFLAKRELSMIDFLALDEVDPRFFNQSQTSNELFGKVFESIIRSRIQNKLPILMVTNSPNVKESFQSLFKDSLGSLMNNIPMFVVLGDDFRKKKI